MASAHRLGAREFRPAEVVGGVPSPREKALVYQCDHLGSIAAITDWGLIRALGRVHATNIPVRRCQAGSVACCEER